MKKKIIIFLLIVLLVIGSFVGYYAYVGHSYYQSQIKEETIEERVEKLKIKETYRSTSDIAETFTSQLVQSEDRRYYEHGAFDAIGLTRAVFHNLITLSFSEGGSTITQQFAKNLVFDYHQTLKRKFAEVFAAVDLENMYSKEEILEMYMNIIYFGHGCYGIQEASQYYYHIDASQLNDEQAKALVHTIKSPNNYNPEAQKNE